MNDKGFNKGNNSTCEGLLNNLNKKNYGLKQKIEHWQNIILTGGDIKNQTQGEKNISSWYRFNNVSYHSDKYTLNKGHQELINKFANDPYYIFKNMVEIMGRDLVSKHLRATLGDKLNHEDSRLQVFVTSDSDDVFGGVDLIVKLEHNGKIEYQGIDIAVSGNKRYLSEKSLAKEETKCIEFNRFEGNNPALKIPRNVLQFSPKIMSEMLSQYLGSIEKGEYLDTLELYKRIKNQNIVETVSETNFKVNNLMRI